MTELEQPLTKERLENRKIALATTIFYPNWSANQVGKAVNADQLRGDLSIRAFKLAQEEGYQVVIVDGGSSEGFREALRDLDIQVIGQEEKGMSGSRRDAFKTAASISGVEAICWTEPEKISMVKNLSEAAEPILAGEADIVVPCRDEESFKTYPEQQAKSEKRANYWYNKVLRVVGLLKPKDPDLDTFFGPRIFRKTPEILKIFTARYELKPGSRLERIVKPDSYLNATFFPIMVALEKGLRVASVPIPYKHPPEQTIFEASIEPEKFEQKRRDQKEDIVRGMIQLARLIINNPQKPSEFLIVS